jgi:2-polyprenyl-3-methyl-5-hydroxy-6-metoxy-1,4-benzoquinol methylase
MQSAVPIEVSGSAIRWRFDMQQTLSDTEKERERINRIANDSWYAIGANGASVRYQTRLFSRYWKLNTCLELGCAEGLTTDELVNYFDHLTCVDGSEVFCKALRKRHPEIEVVDSLFEDFEPDRKFDTIILGHVLEHVEAPSALLARIRLWLKYSGRLLASVPNARSIHRQVAVAMGILETEHSLNATDIHHGHRRVYDPESFRTEFLRAGFSIEVFGGYWLKPVSNQQIDATWTPEMLEAAMQVGERYPDIAGEIYVVASTR